MARLLLEKRFGPLNPAVVQRLEAMAQDQLEQVGIALVTAGSLRELGLED